MKKLILSLALFAYFTLTLPLGSGRLYAQSAEIRPNQGVSVPQFTTAFINSMSTQPKGTVVFDKDLNLMKYWDGTAWQSMSGAAGPGGLSQTANNVANITSGNFGIGTNTPTNKLEINSGVPNKTGLKFTQLSSTPEPLGTSIKFANANVPRGLAIDNLGNLYITEQSTNSISMITPSGVKTTLVSTGLSTPWDITFGPDSNLYVTNYSSNIVSKVIRTTGVVSTYAGGFTNPTGLCFDNSGNLYVVNPTLGTLSKVAPLGSSVTFTFGTGINSANACIYSPLTNKIYVAGNTTNEVSQIDASVGGAKTTFVGSLPAPSGINIDTQGNLYVSLAGFGGPFGGQKVKKISTTAVVSDLFNSSGPSDIVLDTKGNFYVTNTFNSSIDTFTETYPNVLSVNPTGEVEKINKPIDLWVKEGNVIKNTNTEGFWSANPVGLTSSSTNITNPPTAPISGPGTRLMWIPSRSAFRVGTVGTPLWNADSIGLYSFAAGKESFAKGYGSTALGVQSNASGYISKVLGTACQAFGQFSTAIGLFNKAIGNYSIAMGHGNDAIGLGSFTVGTEGRAEGDYSTSLGYATIATDTFSLAIGTKNQINTNGLFMVGNGKTSRKTVFLIRRDNDRVGIGTENPLTPLHVVPTSSLVSSLSGRYFNYGTNSLVSYTGPITATILADGDIVSKTTIGAFQNITASDARIKNIVGLSNSTQDLAKIRKLEITDYTMKDVATWGNKAYKKVIAQQVESVFPQAISMQTAVIPDIYTLAQSVSYVPNSKELTVTMAKNYALKVGDKVEVVHPERGKIQSTIAAISGNSFTLKDWQHPTDKLFVFGREVSDFRTVDYEALSMLGISAIQELAKEVDELKKLRITNEELRATISKQEARLSSIESMLKANVPSGK
jgi:sugar lactone lactonase YvrE